MFMNINDAVVLNSTVKDVDVRVTSERSTIFDVFLVLEDDTRILVGSDYLGPGNYPGKSKTDIAQIHKENIKKLLSSRVKAAVMVA